MATVITKPREIQLAYNGLSDSRRKIIKMWMEINTAMSLFYLIFYLLAKLRTPWIQAAVDTKLWIWLGCLTLACLIIILDLEKNAG